MRLVVLLSVTLLSFPSAHARSSATLQRTILKEQHQLFGFTYRGAKRFLAKARSIPELAWIEKNVQVRNMPPATSVSGIFREIGKPDGKRPPFNTYRQNRNFNATMGLAMLTIGVGSSVLGVFKGPPVVLAGAAATGPGLIMIKESATDHRGLKASVMQSANYAAAYVLTHPKDPRYKPLLNLIPKKEPPKLGPKMLNALDRLAGRLSPDTKL
jgi:hypothetical protein